MKLMFSVTLLLAFSIFATSLSAHECPHEPSTMDIAIVLNQMDLTEVRSGKYPCKVKFSGTVESVWLNDKNFVYSASIALDDLESLTATIHNLSVPDAGLKIGDKISGEAMIVDEAYENLQLWVYKRKRYK